MDCDVIFSPAPRSSSLEIVEKKGRGHPDSLADAISEEACVSISKFLEADLDFIPRFNTDQVAIGGGVVDVNFHRSAIIEKPEIIISGNIPYISDKKNKELEKNCKASVFSYLDNLFGDKAENIFSIKTNFHAYSLNNANFFKSKIPLSEDSVFATGFSPYTPMEKLILDLDDIIFNELRSLYHLGSDTKILAIKDHKKKTVDFLISIAFVAKQMKNIEHYFQTKSKIENHLNVLVERGIDPAYSITLKVNAADDAEQGKAYMTVTGSAAEHDKGISGKGNKLSGLLNPFRCNTFENVFGKNPVYHPGKIYNFMAFELAKEISACTGKSVQINLVSQLGKPISSPKLIEALSEAPFSREEKNSICLLTEGFFTKAFELENEVPRISKKLLRTGNLTHFKLGD